MRKIITISAAVIGVFVVLGIGMAAAASGGAKSSPPANLPTVPLPSASASAAPVDIPVATECADVIATGEAKHAAMVDNRKSWAVREAALDALMADNNYGTPAHDALSTAMDEATAANTITSANLDTARTNFRTAQATAPGCGVFNTIDMQFINADMALGSATPTTQAAADQLWTNAQTAWDSAKAGV